MMDVDAQFNELLLLADQGHVADAAAGLRSLLGEDGITPDISVKALVVLGDLLRQQEQIDEARSALGDALALARQLPDPSVVEAEVEHAQGLLNS